MTPTAGSNFSRYPIPDDLSPDGICCVSVPIPDDPQWFAMLSGALWRLSLQTHWERDAAHSAKIVAARWREIWMEVQGMAGCCNGGAQQNINIYMKMIQTQIYIQTLTQLWIAASLDVLVAFPGCPVDFDTDPGDVGDEVGDRDRALCMIVQSYVDEMFNTGMSWIEDSVLGITSIGVGALAVPIIPVWIIGAGFSAVALALTSLYGELQRSDYRAYMACAMYQALKGVSTNNRGAFADAWDNLPARPPPPEFPDEDIARDAIEAWARAQLSLEGNYVAFVSQLSAAMEIAGQLTDQDCGCLAEWEHTFLDGEGLGDLVILNWPDPPFQPATYNAGADQIEGVCMGFPSGALFTVVDLQFASRTITKVQMTVDYKATNVTVNDHLRLWDGVMDAGFQLKHADVNGEQVVVVSSGAISRVTTQLAFEAVVGVSNSTCPDDSGGRSNITNITINGLGTDPFL